MCPYKYSTHDEWCATILAHRFSIQDMNNRHQQQYQQPQQNYRGFWCVFPHYTNERKSILWRIKHSSLLLLFAALARARIFCCLMFLCFCCFFFVVVAVCVLLFSHVLLVFALFIARIEVMCIFCSAFQTNWVSFTCVFLYAFLLPFL